MNRTLLAASVGLTLATAACLSSAPEEPQPKADGRAQTEQGSTTESSSPASPSASAGRADGGGCAAGEVLYYYLPGCDGAVKPLCSDPTIRHACESWHCGCDGVSSLEPCGQTERPWRRMGKCEALPGADAGGDAS